MLEIIFGSVWGVICFILGCILTFIVCKHYETIPVAEKIQKAMKPKSYSLLDPIIPKLMKKIEYEEDDEDEDNN